MKPRQPLNVGDELVSNNGKGPLHARVISIADDVITLARWNPRTKSRRETLFVLSLDWLMNSLSCGWQSAPKENP